jgi:4-amino-4-deoxy-L-arabinose transferase-like glycosyltransferase
MVLAGSVLFYQLGELPIEVWDEARLANNALEMVNTGLSLITTYDGIPDHWNTKPPLLIWLMSISIRVFGPNESAVRLPSALAALSTVGLIFAFCNFRLKRPFVGFIAVFLLLLERGYMDSHAARSGDYDAMLAFWTTGYLFAGYIYIGNHSTRRLFWLLLCAVGIVLAFLTKTVEGLIFLPGLAIYALSQGRIVQMLHSPSAYLTGAMVLLICVGYYFWREKIDPGYFAAVMQNDLMGRYTTENDEGGPFFYFLPVIVNALLFVGFQFLWGRGERRQISLFLGLVSLVFLAIITFGQTKKAWYAVPLLPLSATIVAIGLEEAVEWVTMHARWVRTIINAILVPICVFASIGLISQNARYVMQRKEWLVGNERNLSSLFLRDPAVQHIIPQKFVVIQQSFVPTFFYAAPTLFYITALRAAGHTIEILPTFADIPAGFNAAVICGATALNATMEKIALKPVLINGKCAIYQISTK